MTRYDLLVRYGSVVTRSGPTRADLAVADGRIVAIGPELDGTTRESIDATGLHLLPGVIDAHIHLNEPGRTDWEGFASGTAALAAGGATSCFDMPLNAHPPTLDAEAFDRKRAAGDASSLVDFGLWGGIVPGNVDHLEDLAERGVIGFKAFMSNSGIDDFPAADDLTLLEGMANAAELGRIVAVHAESDAVTSGLARRATAEGRTGWRDYLASRPAIAEQEAIGRAITFAKETGCALHIVHVSTGRGLALVAEARSRGVDVSCETCPHYLVLTDEDHEHLGALAKCAPPLRSISDREALWGSLLAGDLPMVASDHSPAPPDLKTGLDVFRVWGGISGAQSTLPLLLTEGHHARKVPLATIADASAGFVARRFDLPSKGRLEIGADADFALVALDRSWLLSREDLHDRHRHNPYVGRNFRGRVVRTVLRGIITFIEGKIVSRPVGRLLMPAARHSES